ncbi:AAA family ATPase [Geomonas sp. RF6]|uniref:ATP-binding protein n=1 Tax=Geomonas sp. RF6 TaxID=2897342 RepID=UPI001E476A66|nr:ATP-binding protein [Geomonas sp. RF6]UFS72755.1 AAA family ATPase [Geomonas sp. RF6]
MFRFLKVEVVHWDFWERFTLPMEANVITIVGPNGSGKTTLLDVLRTLLCIDCSSGRDYKRYVRRSDKPFSWLRAVVDNERQESGFRPFFPLLTDQVTLACQIRKKGGDWQRQYLIAEGDVPIEKLEEQGSWIGVRDYRQRLEQAGLTHAICHVLSLEQGDTDKLCEYSPRQLLELVFSVFGDQEVLDNYQQAKHEQAELGRELDKLEEELARLGVRLREAEANVNSFREWQSLTREVEKLSLQTLPCAELSDLLGRIAGNAPGLRKKRVELKARRRSLQELQQRKASLSQELEVARGAEKELEESESLAREEFTTRRDAERDAERVLKDREGLEALCRQQEAGFDAPALAAEQRAARESLSDKNYDLKQVRHQIREIRARIPALLAGEKLEPAHVQEFRQQLNKALIPHRLLTEIVEISDPSWQKALEGVLAPYAHIVLLKNPADRQRAWELGEKLRYRNFVVADRAPVPAAPAGSLLQVVEFDEHPPGWLVEQLSRIRRVESVQEGSIFSSDISWITPEGYHRERRGGRYIGVDKFLFGESARKSLIIELETELQTLQGREKRLAAEIDKVSRRIDEIQSLLSGVDAAQQLAARTEAFTTAEKELPELARQRGEAAQALAERTERLKAAREERVALQSGRSGLNDKIETEERSLQWDTKDFQNLQRQQVERIKDYRERRRPMPPRWYSRAALDELREQYDSAEAVRRDIKRLRDRLGEGSWVTDEQVEAVREKLSVDYGHLEETIKVRRIHHHRHITVTEEARESYINVLRATVRRYTRNVRSLGELAAIGVEVEPPHLVNEDLSLAQAGLNVKFNFDQKGMIGLNDGEASGGQQVMKSLILLIGLLMDESRTGGFVFIDEPFAHLDVFNIDKVGAFLEATRAQYVLTTPNTHNVNVFKTSDLTLVTQKRRHPEKWAPPVAFLMRHRPEAKK